MSTAISEIIVTADDAAWLSAFTRQLVEERWCACAQHINPVQSTYRWDGSVHEDAETRVALHTRTDLVPALIGRIKKDHPYDVPCILAFQIARQIPTTKPGSRPRQGPPCNPAQHPGRPCGHTEEVASACYVTRPLAPGTWDDFAQLVEANNGVWGGCWCMGFHPEGVGRGHTVAQNRDGKLAHVRNGAVHQILVYDGDDCVGWCQYGTPVELPNINNPKAYAKELSELPDWRIGCIFTGSRHRRHGVARAALGGALTAIREAGGGLVEAYPEQVEEREPQRGAYFHTGPTNLFEEFGFERDRKIAKWRWVMRLRIPSLT